MGSRCDAGLKPAWFEYSIFNCVNNCVHLCLFITKQKRHPVEKYFYSYVLILK